MPPPCRDGSHVRRLHHEDGQRAASKRMLVLVNGFQKRDGAAALWELATLAVVAGAVQHDEDLGGGVRVGAVAGADSDLVLDHHDGSPSPSSSNCCCRLGTHERR